jgi:hypothetical protein
MEHEPILIILVFVPAVCSLSLLAKVREYQNKTKKRQNETKEKPET